MNWITHRLIAIWLDYCYQTRDYILNCHILQIWSYLELDHGFRDPCLAIKINDVTCFVVRESTVCHFIQATTFNLYGVVLWVEIKYCLPHCFACEGCNLIGLQRVRELITLVGLGWRIAHVQFEFEGCKSIGDHGLTKEWRKDWLNLMSDC